VKFTIYIGIGEWPPGSGKIRRYTGSTIQELQKRITESAHEFFKFLNSPGTTIYERSGSIIIDDQTLRIEGEGKPLTPERQTKRGVTVVEQLVHEEPLEGEPLNKYKAAREYRMERDLSRYRGQVEPHSQARTYKKGVSGGGALGVFFDVWTAVQIARDANIAKQGIVIGEITPLFFDKGGIFTIKEGHGLRGSGEYFKEYLMGPLREKGLIDIPEKLFNYYRWYYERDYGRLDAWGNWKPGRVRKELPCLDCS
jgi:hypothetical protein